jgi:hypothetical protein
MRPETTTQQRKARKERAPRRHVILENIEQTFLPVNKEANNTTTKQNIVPKRKKQRVKDVSDGRIEADSNDTIPIGLPNEVLLQQVAFCCYNCFCSNEIKDQIGTENMVIQSSEVTLYHRRCCHNAIEWDENWLSEYEQAVENMIVDDEDEDEDEEDEPKNNSKINNTILDPNDIKQIWSNIALQNTKIYNNDDLPGMYLLN